MVLCPLRCEKTALDKQVIAGPTHQIQPMTNLSYCPSTPNRDLLKLTSPLNPISICKGGDLPDHVFHLSAPAVRGLGGEVNTMGMTMDGS